ncbi:MAG TPA: bifunctional demethylmenaquinone methyltransferase/2-methoxy-6-polyprenyl-1,4-benzoquinol methylase UbiE [Sulfurivirga caldicuralii]|nr:bifunctional demethylmenaquinone methyltransferase/2-methoxy-6-polyprenyl-1,4-benzoquinol methylase UbiE [Sulfurivirga caldicuralii]
MGTNKTVDFGFKEVPWEEKVKHVKSVFDAVADKYDLMNDVMSFGIHRLWKRFAVETAGVRPGMRVLDVAGGTGDLTKALARRVAPNGEVVLADINENMVNVGRRRLVDAGVAQWVDFAIANAEQLPFEEDCFDRVTIAFGLRNVTDKAAALREMARVLKPGGQVLILEFSQVEGELLRKAYDFYSFHILPRMGKVIAKDEDSYRYLAESIRKHPSQQALKEMMLEAGFDRAEYTNLNQGIVALHRGWVF